MYSFLQRGEEILKYCLHIKDLGAKVIVIQSELSLVKLTNLTFKNT